MPSTWAQSNQARSGFSRPSPKDGSRGRLFLAGQLPHQEEGIGYSYNSEGENIAIESMADAFSASLTMRVVRRTWTFESAANLKTAIPSISTTLE